MPQSLAQILVHLVFSTKNREACLDDADRDALHGYIGGIIANHDGVLLCAGSVSDHIHLLLAHPRTCAPSDLVREIKVAATIWLKARDSRYHNFHWQSGYGMFSISPSHRRAVEDYIGRQAEHHKSISFQEEYLKLLKKYNQPYDERYVWD